MVCPSIIGYGLSNDLILSRHFDISLPTFPWALARLTHLLDSPRTPCRPLTPLTRVPMDPVSLLAGWAPMPPARPGQDSVGPDHPPSPGNRDPTALPGLHGAPVPAPSQTPSQVWSSVHAKCC